jgi:hypothetical protein
MKSHMALVHPHRAAMARSTRCNPPVSLKIRAAHKPATPDSGRDRKQRPPTQRAPIGSKKLRNPNDPIRPTSRGFDDVNAIPRDPFEIRPSISAHGGLAIRE